MKRNLALSLMVAVVATAASGVAFATTDLALNLNYINPANEATGGTWQLVAKTTDVNGLAGLDVNLTGAGIAATFGAGTATADVQTSAVIGANLNIAWGFDLDGTDIAGTGTGSGNGNQAVDPLFNAIWNNSALIATGTFGAVRPVIVSSASNVHTAASLAGTGAAITDLIGLSPVRGDGVATDGLLEGDANRDWTVNSSDLGLLLNSFNSTTGTWDQGNFNNTAGAPNTDVNSADLGLLLNNFNGSAPVPAVGAVPEPSSAVLLLMASASLACATRRKK